MKYYFAKYFQDDTHYAGTCICATYMSRGQLNNCVFYRRNEPLLRIQLVGGMPIIIDRNSPWFNRFLPHIPAVQRAPPQTGRLSEKPPVPPIIPVTDFAPDALTYYRQEAKELDTLTKILMREIDFYTLTTTRRFIEHKTLTDDATIIHDRVHQILERASARYQSLYPEACK